MMINSINPNNNEVIGSVKETIQEEVKRIFNACKNATNMWGITSLDERLIYLNNLYNKFVECKEELSMLISKEMGMPINYSVIDTDFALECFRWYLDNAKEIIGDKVTFENEEEIDKLIYEPKGVAAVIIAWNLPFSSFVWQVIPNLIVGNTVILKHSELVVLSSKYISDITIKILPENVFNVVYGDAKVGEYLVDEDIDLICFTGSTNVGKILYRKASEKFIPVLLECGGSAPGIVLEDADIDKVIESIYINRFVNNGQTCDGEKRLIVHRSKEKEVTEKLKTILEEKTIGDSTDMNSDFGPIVSLNQLEKIDNQVKDAIDNGAKVIIGGRILDKNNGYFYEPTILINITKDMKVFKEEVFGPVLPIITFDTIEEAVELANDTEYGLGSYVYTENKDNYERIAKELKTGMVALNNLYYLRPCNPFGGYKMSGFGKNNSPMALQELCNVKVVTYEK